MRVRTRLGDAEDQRLPKILGALLPKLLMKLNRNDAALLIEASSPNKSNIKMYLLRKELQNHLADILDHALHRIRANPKMSAASWTDSIQTYLAENQVAELLPETVERAFVFLRTAFARHQSLSLPPLIQMLDALAQEAFEGSSQRAGLLCETCAFCLDSLAIQEWNGIHRQDMVEKEATLSGTGVFHLFLNALLATHELREGQEPGLSMVGLDVWKHYQQVRSDINQNTVRGTMWTSRTKTEQRANQRLSLACLRYATINPDIISPERAAILCVLASPNVDSSHGAMANQFLRQWKTTGSSTGSASVLISFVLCLLILILGDDNARPILNEYPAEAYRWLLILGPQPTAGSSMKRPPLPLHIANLAVLFIGNHAAAATFATGSSEQEKDGIALLARLIACVRIQDQDRHLWAMHLLRYLYSQISPFESATWAQPIRLVCHDLLMDVLRTVVEPRQLPDQQVINARVNVVPMPGAAPQTGQQPQLPRLGVTNLLIPARTRFDQQVMHRCYCEESRESRRLAYQMLTEMLPSMENDNSSLSPLQVPIKMLFLCVSREDEKLKGCAERVLEGIFNVYRARIAKGDLTTDLDGCTHCSIAPILPALLGAICSPSAQAAKATKQWIDGILRPLDPESADLFDSFLRYDDSMTTTSSMCKELAAMSEKKSRKLSKNINFLDTSKPAEWAELNERLESQLTMASTTLDLSYDATCMILHDHSFQACDAEKALATDREATLRQSGFNSDSSSIQPHRGSSKDMICEICYETIEEKDGKDSNSLALACGHQFCKSCWDAYLHVHFEQWSARSLSTTCPRHDCKERITCSDIEALAPEMMSDWKEAFLKSFVVKDNNHGYCRGPNCSMVVAASPNKPDVSGEVICYKCQANFCFRCGGTPHDPVSCKDMIRWNTIVGTSGFWIRSNSKPCPGCRAPIEKNMGCNHMECTSCGFHFCWVCLAPVRSHLEPHFCERYDPSKTGENEDERRALFYMDQFMMQEEAETFAKDDLHTIRRDKAVLNEAMDEESFQIIEHTLEMLCKTRNFLKHTYVATFALGFDDPVSLHALETYQATLEQFTEFLHS
eukprot:CAMPEP_0197467012 /NCGR_PEP_ID=MMETSP1175-20131217/65348_1 /TAXON_ID=1003142 /ORGANISM="Triceratium dubium, Strain CCMP147" /LENGTH=1073 /DNA_ID=CAMNT_0043003073 /DNA_START=1 /DNA_END=3222 /DNA_ORIENTATION=+